MKKSEIAEKFKELGTKETVEEIRAAISDLQNEFETDYEEHEKVQTKNDELVTENQKLKDANMKLFLATNDKGKEEEVKLNEKEYKFEDLFDEKGGLK